MVSSAIWFMTAVERTLMFSLSCMLPFLNEERVNLVRPMMMIMNVTVISSIERKKTVDIFFLIELGLLSLSDVLCLDPVLVIICTVLTAHGPDESVVAGTATGMH